jgi:hypothetical protein
MQSNLKLVESEPSPLDVVMAKLRAKARAAKSGLAASLVPIVDEIELALSAEHGELEDARRLRQLAKLREEAARGHAVRIGRLLQHVKRRVPHGQFQEWVAKQNFGGRPATEYMRIARERGARG